MINEPKVLGIGVNKTGTTTLAECLRILGYGVCPEDQAYTLCGIPTKPAFSMLESYSAFADYPWFLPNYYQTVAYLYPSSKFILTIRDPDTWWESIDRWVKRFDMTMAKNYVYGSYLSTLDRESAIATYNKHNRTVQTFFEGSGRLLVADWEKGYGWATLTKFLGKDFPTDPFPHKLRYDAETDSYV